MFNIAGGIPKTFSCRCKCLFQQHVRHKTHYEVLGISKDASDKEIRDAFLDCVKQMHPDTKSQDKQSHEKFVKVNEAYTVLKEPRTRADYDETLKPPPPSRDGPTHQYGHPQANTYHSDGRVRMYYYTPNVDQRWRMYQDFESQGSQDEQLPKFSKNRTHWTFHVFGVFILLAFSLVVAVTSERRLSRNMQLLMTPKEDPDHVRKERIERFRKAQEFSKARKQAAVIEKAA